MPVDASRGLPLHWLPDRRRAGSSGQVQCASDRPCARFSDPRRPRNLYGTAPVSLKPSLRWGNALMKLLAGNSNLPLARSIAEYLETPLTDASVRRFADEEVFVEINENVRGEDVFVIQSTSYPANDNLMELLICIDALRRASAKRITAVLPYFGYARQDRKPGPRTPISAKLVANLITTAGANRVLSIDLHAGQIQGFFDIPTDNLFASPVIDRHSRTFRQSRPPRCLARRWRSGARSRACEEARQRSACDRRQPS